MVHVEDSTATFTPTAGRPSTLDHRSFTGPEGESVWSSAAINGMLDEARRRLHELDRSLLNATQAAVLASRVRTAPAPPLAWGWRGGAPPFRITSHVGEGTLHVLVGDPSTGAPVKPLWILRNGHTVQIKTGYSPLVAPRLDPKTGLPKTRVTLAPKPSQLNINQTPLVLLLVETVACVVLGVVLSAAGLLAVLGWNLARPLHQFYAVAKLLVITFGVVVAVWLYQELRRQIGGVSQQEFLAGAIRTIKLQCAYPIFLLAHFNLPHVRRYFDGGDGGAEPAEPRELDPFARVMAGAVALASLAAGVSHGWLVSRINAPESVSLILWHLAGLTVSGLITWVAMRWALLSRGRGARQPGAAERHGTALRSAA